MLKLNTNLKEQDVNFSLKRNKDESFELNRKLTDID